MLPTGVARPQQTSSLRRLISWQQPKSTILLTQSIAGLLEGPDSLKPLAAQVVIGLDKAFEPGAKQMDADTKVASVAAMLMRTMGWLKSD